MFAQRHPAFDRHDEVAFFHDSESGLRAIVDPDRVHTADVDLFCPCALGGILNDRTIGELKALMVVSAANNQLAEARHGDLLRKRGVLYAPDYVVNAGSLIAVAAELESRPQVWVNDKIDGIAATLDQIFRAAEREETSTSHLAEARIQAIEESLRRAA